MKLKNLRLANSLRMGGTELQFFLEKDFDLELRNPIITIISKKDGEKTCTSLYNTKQFCPVEDSKEDK